MAKCETCGSDNDTKYPQYDSVACRVYAREKWTYPLKDGKRR